MTDKTIKKEEIKGIPEGSIAFLLISWLQSPSSVILCYA